MRSLILILMMCLGTLVRAETPKVDKAEAPKADKAEAGSPPANPGGSVSGEAVPVQDNSADSFTYDPTGKRDPFEPELPKTSTTPVEVTTSAETAPEEPAPDHPLEPLESYDLSQLRLSAIIWNTVNPRAMLTDPVGRTHYVKAHSRIGRRNGFVVAIREGEIVVVEYIWENGQYSKIFKVLELR